MYSLLWVPLCSSFIKMLYKNHLWIFFIPFYFSTLFFHFQLNNKWFFFILFFLRTIISCFFLAGYFIMYCVCVCDVVIILKGVREKRNHYLKNSLRYGLCKEIRMNDIILQTRGLSFVVDFSNLDTMISVELYRCVGWTD